jgi:CheY-like chemotaxis protein
MSTGDVKRQFGTAIRSQRIEQQISQEVLADRAGLHRTYISDVERGARNPSLESIERLARALEVSVASLFARAETRDTEATLEILLVEDEPEDVELTRRAFRKAGMTNAMYVARDGAEALDFLFATGAHQGRSERPLPAVILLDLKLPKLDGIEVLRRIKADKRTRTIPVVILTGSHRDRDMAACRALGAERYIAKPVDFLNFSELAPHLKFGWALVKPKRKTIVVNRTN